MHGKLEQAKNYVAQVRKLNASRGVPPNPLSDSLSSAAVEIWYLGQNDRGIRAVDAALASTPMKSLSI